MSADTANNSQSRPAKWRLRWLPGKSSVSLNDGTVLTNFLFGWHKKQTLDLHRLININKLNSQSKYTTKLNNYLDSAHKTTTFTTWHTNMPKWTNPDVMLKLCCDIQKATIRFLKQHSMWSPDIEASIVAAHVCAQMSLDSEEHVLNIILSYGFCHYRLGSFIIGVKILFIRQLAPSLG